MVSAVNTIRLNFSLIIPKKRELVFSQDVVCEQDGLRPDRIHHMIFAGSNTIYAGENDNNDRSSYLWELELEN